MADVIPRTFGFPLIWRPGDFLVSVHRMKDHQEVAPHDHVFHEIVYVESGTAEHLTVQGSRRLHPGDIIVLLPRIWHGYRRTQSLTIINCLFDGSLLRRYGAMLSLLSGSFSLFRRRERNPGKTAPTVLHARPSQRVHLLRGFETMMAELNEKPKNWQAEVIVRLLDCLVTIARLGPEEQGRASIAMASRADEAVVEAVDFLEAHFTETLGLADLAKRLHLSPSYLSRSFTKRMGMGIVEYQHHLRVEEACRLLRHSEEPIGRIAGMVGYDEVAYFSRCFRDQMNVAPREYRYAYKTR